MATFIRATQTLLRRLPWAAARTLRTSALNRTLPRFPLGWQLSAFPTPRWSSTAVEDVEEPTEPLQLFKGEDILGGRVKDMDEAWKVISSKCSKEHVERLKKIKTRGAIMKIANAIVLCEPDSVWVSTGSEEDKAQIRKFALEKGEEAPLAMPGHTVHFDLPEEQGRIIDRTFYIVNKKERTSVFARRIQRDTAKEYVNKEMNGIMKGKRMLIGFFCRGPPGAKVSMPAIEITSSAYVVHSGDLLYRHCFDNFDEQVAHVGNLFLANLHSEGMNRPEDLKNARVFMDRSWLTTFSTYCTYAGNTLLLKKGNHRFAVDLATYMGQGKVLSEHMFVTGIKDPQTGEICWLAGASPSGCGKTTTAMAGTDFVGDDLAQMWIAEDGSVRAINPEQGMFGIVRDVNYEGDPHLMKCLREPGTEVIYSNLCVDQENVPHWEGDGQEENFPKQDKPGKNFQGEWYVGKTKTIFKDGEEKQVPIPVSHPNARCTLRNDAIANYNVECGEDPNGVALKVITYSGRDSDTMPPLWVAKNADHGVVIGACVVSEPTATEIGVKAKLRRQPWANEPFIPGPLADHLKIQFDFYNNEKIADEHKPIFAGLNFFLTHGARSGQAVQRTYGWKRLLGEKQDVKVWLRWLTDYSAGRVDAISTPIGYLPKFEDLRRLFKDVLDKKYTYYMYDKQFSLHVDKILSRIQLQRSAFRKEPGMPERLWNVLDEWEDGLLELRSSFFVANCTSHSISPHQAQESLDEAERVATMKAHMAALAAKRQERDEGE